MNDSLSSVEHDERRPGAALFAILISALIGGIAILAVCAGVWLAVSDPAPAAAEPPITLSGARLDCDPSVFTATSADDGRTLLVEADDQRGEETVECLADRLAMPEAVYAQIRGTRALDGRQSASWDGYRASWTYHPDAGLSMIIEEES